MKKYLPCPKLRVRSWPNWRIKLQISQYHCLVIFTRVSLLWLDDLAFWYGLDLSLAFGFCLGLALSRCSLCRALSESYQLASSLAHINKSSSHQVTKSSTRVKIPRQWYWLIYSLIFGRYRSQMILRTSGMVLKFQLSQPAMAEVQQFGHSITLNIS